MMQAALYCRVSTSEQKEEGTSLDTQRDQGLIKASELEWTVSQEHVIQEDWTGNDLQRPGLLRLLDLARSGEIRGIIIYTLDRLYRPENDGDEWRVFEVLQQFQDAGVEVAWVDSSIPTHGPLSAVFTFLNAWRAGKERRAIVERTTRGRLEKARRGKVISRAAASYGHRFDPHSSTLMVLEDEAKVVRLVFHLYTQEHLSLAQLTQRLNRLGIGRPRGGNRWHPSNLGRMLRNEAYAGTLCQNKWQRQVVSNPGQRPKAVFRERPKAEQIPVEVPAIVVREVFGIAQKRLEENLRFARRNAKRSYLLSGLVKHVCGSSMGGSTSHVIGFYRCLRSHKPLAPINERGEPQPCSCKWVNGKAVEAAVWDTVTDLLRHPDLLMQELEKLTQPDSATRVGLEEELSQLRERLERLPKEERRLVEGYRKGFYADFMMREEMERIMQERASAEERCLELETRLAHLERAMSYQGQVEEPAERLSHGLDNMDFTECRELLRLLVDEVAYDDGDVTIRTIIPIEQLHPIPRRVRVPGGSTAASTPSGSPATALLHHGSVLKDIRHLFPLGSQLLPAR